MDVFIKKLGKAVEVDLDRLSPEIMTKVIEYGLKQKLSDGLSEASVAKGNSVEEMAFSVAEAIAGLYEGNWTSRSADPVAAVAKAIATAQVKGYTKQVIAKAMEVQGWTESESKFKAALVSKIAAKPETLAKARAQLAATAEAGEVDLADLKL